MVKTFKRFFDNDQISEYTSVAYLEGQKAYLSWYANGGDRPNNPYWFGMFEESADFVEWQRGWDDASFDV